MQGLTKEQAANTTPIDRLVTKKVRCYHANNCKKKKKIKKKLQNQSQKRNMKSH